MTTKTRTTRRAFCSPHANSESLSRRLLAKHRRRVSERFFLPQFAYVAQIEELTTCTSPRNRASAALVLLKQSNSLLSLDNTQEIFTNGTILQYECAAAESESNDEAGAIQASAAYSRDPVLEVNANVMQCVNGEWVSRLLPCLAKTTRHATSAAADVFASADSTAHASSPSAAAAAAVSAVAMAAWPSRSYLVDPSLCKAPNLSAEFTIANVPQWRALAAAATTVRFPHGTLLLVSFAFLYAN